MATSHFAVFVLALAAAGLQSAQATNYPDLYAFKYEGASGSSEVHVLSGADEYKAFNLQTGTGLHKSSSDTFTLLRNSKDDLFAVKYKGDSDSTEVHILSKASKYKKFSLQTATGLHTTSADTFQFLLDSNDNLVAIKYEGKSKHTEVHVLSAASDYKEFILQTATGLHTTTFDTFQFALGSNDDLYCFKYEGESLKTEVHVLSKASGYKKFSLQTPTALEETSFDTFRFLIGPNDDLYAIKYEGESKSTEVHVLSKDSDYKKFILQTGTKLHTTSSDTFAFALGYSAPDLPQKPSN